MKNSNQKSDSETACGVDNSEVVSESSAAREVRDVLRQILREGAQKMLRTAIQKEVDEYLPNRTGIVSEDGESLKGESQKGTFSMLFGTVIACEFCGLES